MTNGEKLQSIFPKMKYEVICNTVLTDIDNGAWFCLDWWNAEYKEPTESRELEKTRNSKLEKGTTKNDLGVDAVSRKAVHDMLENLPITVEDKWFNWLQKACMRLAELPSVTPQFSSSLEKNSKKLEKGTTKNDLVVEKIIDELEKEFEKVNIPIMDKLTLFAKMQNALYRCADMREVIEE